MNPRLNPTLLSLVLTNLILLKTPSIVCQNEQQYETCRQPFECGSITGIGYPFWGGSRPAYCGYPGFELNCQGNVLRLNVSTPTYRVLAIDNRTQTLRVARDDLSDTICPRFLFNTSLDFSIFDYSSTANDQNITLYYGCPLNLNPLTAFPNLFPCNANGTDSSSYYLTREASRSLPANISTTCRSSILVPVNQTMAQALGSFPTTTASLAGLLQSALESGFSIQWSADDNNCNNCVRSGGLCGYNQNSRSFACYCTDRAYNLTCNNTQNASKRGLSDLQKYVIIGVPLGVTGIVRSSFIIFYIKKQYRLHKLDEESNQNVEKFLPTHVSLAPKRYSYREIKQITKSFTDKLGQGGYGIVYKGMLTDGQLVAVKVLTETYSNGEEFINEVASISRTSHVNIVNLEWEKLYEIAVGVARGLEYLHRGCNTRIVHFDIKPQNILLDQDFCPKISDFGLAKLFKKKQSVISMLGTRGTIGYIAPEVFSRNFGRVSHKSDVYSYGMMLLEMAGARENVEIEAIESSGNYFPDKIYEHVVLKNEKLDDLMTEEDDETARKMILVGLWCIQTAPSDRPSMTKVVEMLEGSLQSIQIPPKPFLSSPKLSGQLISSSFSFHLLHS